MHRLSGEEVAVKVIDKESENYFEFSDVIENEMAMLKTLPKSHHIIEYYEKFETRDKIYLIFEIFVGDELYELVKKKKK